MEACSLLVNLRKGMQSSSEQPLVGEEHCVTTLITAATTKQAYRDELVVYLFFSPIYIYIYFSRVNV